MTQIYSANTNRFRRKPLNGWDRLQNHGWGETTIKNQLKFAFVDQLKSKPQPQIGSLVKTFITDKERNEIYIVWVLLLDWVEQVTYREDEMDLDISLEIQCFNQKHEAEAVRMLKNLPKPDHVFVRKFYV